MADWNLPLLTSSYTQFLTNLKDRDADSLTMLDGVTPANLPAKAKRWNDANKQFETWDGTAWAPIVLGLSGGGTGATTAAQARTNIGAAAASHTHTIANVTGLQVALDGKAPASHTHTIANVTNLQAVLDGKAAASHTHTIGNVANLQAALDGKAPTSHGHSIADITNLQAALDGKASTASLGGKANLTGAAFTGRITVTADQGWEGVGGAFEARAIGAGTSAGPALMAFHRPNAYAVMLGLDMDNQMKIGGWSAGANRYLIWHSGNLNPGAYVDWGNHVAKHAVGQVISVQGIYNVDTVANGSPIRFTQSGSTYIAYPDTHIGGTWVCRGRTSYIGDEWGGGDGYSLFQRVA